MKSFILPLAFFLFSFYSSIGQTTKNEQKELYPDKYTFEKAKEFEQKGEYEKAIWFYINLFSGNKPQVIKNVKIIATKLSTVDMSLFIKKSFALYATFDPMVTSFNNGVASVDREKLKQKGAWGDELIKKISQ